jgi:hypothetical protein
MRARHDDFNLVAGDDREDQPAPVDLRKLDRNGELHPFGRGSQMPHIDMNADSGLAVIELAGHAVQAFGFQQADEMRRGEHGYTRIAISVREPFGIGAIGVRRSHPDVKAVHDIATS